jgi:hypothetical protein
MTVSDKQSIFGPPTAGDEVATLLGSLERQRATFAWKVGGLDEKGLAAKIGASAITLGGLIKHLAFVEDFKLTTMVLGQNLVAPWDTVDWENDAGWPWHSAARDAGAGREPARKCESDHARPAREGSQLRRRRAMLTAQ